jgi:hypothetical protein
MHAGIYRIEGKNVSITPFWILLDYIFKLTFFYGIIKL